ncbi:hypothetical protein Tco_0059040 [Tanacetum coccineum]
MPSLPSPEPTVSCFDDLDFFKDFENEFPAIVYNDTQTSKSDLLTKPILSPQHIDEFDLNDKTSLSEYNEEEQNVMYFNDLFPFNIIYPDDLKSEKDNDDNEIDIIQSSKGNEITQDMALPPRDQRHQYLRYEGLQYSDADIVDFKARLARIYMMEVHRVQVFDFGELSDLMAEGMSARMLMEHKDAQGVSLFTSRSWRRLFDIRRPLVHELILEFFSTFRFGEAVTDFDTARALQFQLGGARRISSAGDFLSITPSYTLIRDPILRLCHKLITCSIVRRSQAPKKVVCSWRKSGDLISRGQFIARLAKHFGLLTEERLWGLTVIAPTLPVIDMAELAILALVQEPQQPPPPPAVGRTMPQRLGRLEEEVEQTCQAFDRTFQGRSPIAFQRRTRQRTDGASTFAAQQGQQQPDP